MIGQGKGEGGRTAYEVFRYVLDDSPLANDEEVTVVVELAERWLKRLLAKLPNSERGIEFLRTHQKLCDAIRDFDKTPLPTSITPPNTPPKKLTSRNRKSAAFDSTYVGRTRCKAKAQKSPTTNARGDKVVQQQARETTEETSADENRRGRDDEEPPEDLEEEQEEDDEVAKLVEEPSARSVWTMVRAGEILKGVSKTLCQWSNQMYTRTLTTETLTLTDELKRLKSDVRQITANTMSEHLRLVDGTHGQLTTFARYSLIELNVWFEERKLQLRVEGMLRRVGPAVTTELVETELAGTVRQDKPVDAKEKMAVRKGWLRKLRAGRRWNDMYTFFGRGILFLPTTAFDLESFGDASDCLWTRALAQYKRNAMMTAIAENLGVLGDQVLEGQISGVRMTDREIDEGLDKIKEGLMEDDGDGGSVHSESASE